jgi:hypothetical protein
VFPEKKARTSWRRFTKASAATTRPSTRWSTRPSDELSIGPQLWATPKNSSEGAKGANIAKQQHVPAYKLVTIPPTWPFASWGLDMIGPLPTAPGGFNRVLVAIDKFTMLIKVKPVTCPKADRVLDFLDELVHHYGLPQHIITDLGSNFNNHQFWEYCENSGIDV